MVSWDGKDAEKRIGSWWRDGLHLSREERIPEEDM